MPIASVNGQQLNYEDSGGDGPVVILAHGSARDRIEQRGACLLGRDDITDRLKEITCPALVVRGEADVAIDAQRAASLAEGLVGSTGVVTVPGGHSANMTDPAAVNAAIVSFLAGLAST